MGNTLDARVTEIGRLFGPDTLASDQYLDTCRRKLPLEPEKRLMMAVLEDAVTAYQKYLRVSDKNGSELFREAEEWIFGNDDPSIFSYTNVCEILGFSPSYLRNGILRWKEDTLSKKHEPPKNKFDRSVHPQK